MSHFFSSTIIWLVLTLFFLGLCTFLPIKIKDDVLRSRVMRWVLVPVSVLLMAYAYPVGIEVFRKIALAWR